MVGKMVEGQKFTGLIGASNNNGNNYYGFTQGFYQELGDGTNMSIDSLQTGHAGGSVSMSVDNSSVGSNDSLTHMLSHPGLKPVNRHNYSVSVGQSVFRPGKVTHALNDDALAQALVDNRYPTEGLQYYDDWTIDLRKLNMGTAFAQGLLPFQNMTAVQAAFAVVNKGVRPIIPYDCLPVLSYIMTRCWDANPEIRPSFTDVVRMLENAETQILTNVRKARFSGGGASMYLPTVAIDGDLSFVLSCLSYNKRTQAAEELNSHIVAAADDPSFLSLITGNHQIESRIGIAESLRGVSVFINLFNHCKGPKFTGIIGGNTNNENNYYDFTQGFYQKLGEGTNMSIDSLQTSNAGGSVSMSVDNSSVGSSDSLTHILSHPGLKPVNHHYSGTVGQSVFRPGKVTHALNDDALAQALMNPKYPTEGLQNYDEWTIDLRKLNMGTAFAQACLTWISLFANQFSITVFSSMDIGLLPFQNMTAVQAAFAVVNKGVRPVIPNDCLPVLSEIMTRCWDTNPEVRPPFTEIVRMLENAETEILTTVRKARFRCCMTQPMTVD
ncbi:hypothetical protein D5086_031360 [Populus alba]|uniref:Uncharacterized protein n=1 Tax=Populus alba TaxID=43335 RepID=A0ACC4AIC7_POPAL